MKHIIDDKLLLAFARKNPTISIFYLANALIDKNKKIPFINDILDGNRIDTSVFDEVVGYLNSKTNKKFRAKTPATKRVINARLATNEADINNLPKSVEIKIAMFKESEHFDLLAENAIKIILQDYSSLYQNEKAKHFIALHDNEIIACVGAFIKSDLPYKYYQTPYYGFIGDVYTIPNERKKGISKKLTKLALDWFVKNKVSDVKLLASKDAQHLYKKFGFESTDEMALKIKT